MSQKNKDELVQLLRSLKIAEFNEARPNDKSFLLDLSEVDLSGLQLSDADLSNADLTGADFGEAELASVKFTNSDLTSVNFARTSITESLFIDAVLNGTKFIGARVSNSEFADSDMSGADFSDCDLTNSDLTAALNLPMCKFDAYTIWPDLELLPEDFDAEYIQDLASLNDEEDSTETVYDY